MDNVYDEMIVPPILEGKKMPADLEQMAQQLVARGQLRIALDGRRNFARFSIPTRNVHQEFSLRQLTEPRLLAQCESLLYHTLQREEKLNEADARERASEWIKRLQKEVKQQAPLPEKMEIKLARMVTQAAHPAVIALLLLEETEIFISCARTIGDLMDMASQMRSGKNSGMQALSGQETAVYISCGGDPFLQGKDARDPADGEAAMARFMVIAGQELGHFADIKRRAPNEVLGRYSSNPQGNRANPDVESARQKDISEVTRITEQLHQLGVTALARLETELEFYRKNKRLIRALFKRVQIKIAQQLLFFRAQKQQAQFVLKFPYKLPLGTRMLKAIDDMAYNLEPQADVYKSKNPEMERAILCIEALARVPQQVNKWGFDATQAAIPHLFRVYYGQVIPGCIKVVEAVRRNS